MFLASSAYWVHHNYIHVSAVYRLHVLYSKQPQTDRGREGTLKIGLQIGQNAY